MELYGIKPRIVFQTAAGSPLGRITLAGLLQQHAGVPEKPMRTLGNYALVYLLKGKGVYKDARGVQFRLGPGDLWFVFPEVPHWYGPVKGTRWDEFHLVFSGPAFDLWREKGVLNLTRKPLHLQPVNYWLRRFHELAAGELGPLQRMAALQQVLAEVLAAADDSRPSRWLAQAGNLIQSGDEVGRIARTLGMSYESFRKRFTAAAGVSPGHYRTMKLIDKACALMVAGGTTNKEVARRLGFCDEFHFSRRFKKIMGLTPAQFRLKLPAMPKRT